MGHTRMTLKVELVGNLPCCLSLRRKDVHLKRYVIKTSLENFHKRRRFLLLRVLPSVFWVDFEEGKWALG